MLGSESPSWVTGLPPSCLFFCLLLSPLSLFTLSCIVYSLHLSPSFHDIIISFLLPSSTPLSISAQPLSTPLSSIRLSFQYSLRFTPSTASAAPFSNHLTPSFTLLSSFSSENIWDCPPISTSPLLPVCSHPAPHPGACPALPSQPGHPRENDLETLT